MLREEFELVKGSYRRSDSGKSLTELLKSDWAMFPDMDDAHAKELLAEILDDGEAVRQKFESIYPASSLGSALARWKLLAEELMHQNRFFPKEALDPEHFRRLFGHLLLSKDDIPTRWYRARIQQTEEPFRPEEMTAPPKDLAAHGRANPAGIPYLYLASTESTAICEIRPHPGEHISIAGFNLPGSIAVVDLVEPRRTVSPFVVEDEESISQLGADIDFLEHLGMELARPVIPGSAWIEYVPSQYLSELIKSFGFDGVLYKSSLTDGINLALFDPDKAMVGAVSQKLVERVQVDTKPH